MKKAPYVTPPEEAESLATRVAQLVRRDPNGTCWLRRVPDWLVVPAEGSCHLNDLDRERLAAAYERSGHQSVVAVRVEDLLDEPVAYTSDATQDGIRRIDRTWASFNYVLCPTDLSSIVVCSSDDFLVFAGSSEFIECATGGSVSEAFDAFRAYGVRIGAIWPRMPAFVKRVDLALSEDYPKAELGTWVEVPRDEPAHDDSA